VERFEHAAIPAAKPKAGRAALDGRRLEVPPDVRMTLQERAYTSPIWYSPN